MISPSLRYLTLHLPAERGFVNLTPRVEEAVGESGVREGLCLKLPSSRGNSSVWRTPAARVYRFIERCSAVWRPVSVSTLPRGTSSYRTEGAWPESASSRAWVTMPCFRCGTKA
jgi:hypothetical protein